MPRRHISMLLAALIGCHKAAPLDVPPAPPSAATSCAALRKMSIPPEAIGVDTHGATLTRATMVGAYCQINGTIAPIDPAAPRIHFQVNLPTAWNHRALQLGGGGFDGRLITGVEPLDMAPSGSPTPLGRGYVTFGDDSGHQSAHITDASFARNDEALANYGGLTLKKTHDVAMAIVQARYGEKPARVYFYGSSTGGRDGLTAVQRWPSDYDGIVVHRPALNYTGMRLSNVTLGRALYRNGGAGWLDEAKTIFLQKTVMNACDALDGIADGLIAHVTACKANSEAILAAVRCPNDAETCLSEAQIATIRTIAAPLELPYALANEVKRYPGYHILAGAVFAGPDTTRNFGDAPKPSNPANKHDANAWVTGDQWVKFFVTREPMFDTLTFDPMNPGAYQVRVQEVSALTDATNTDLFAFRIKGGKIIMTHGLADEIVSTDSSVDYYEGLVQRFGQGPVDDFVRFYLMPGVGHGTGPFHPALDALSALEQWVERAKAPETLLVSDLHRGTRDRTRPLCRYPSWPQYVGGNIDIASSFRCTAE